MPEGVRGVADGAGSVDEVGKEVGGSKGGRAASGSPRAPAVGKPAPPPQEKVPPPQEKAPPPQEKAPPSDEKASPGAEQARRPVLEAVPPRLESIPAPPIEVPVPVQVDPVESAKAAGLRYVNDTRPGFTRKRAGKHFSYLGLDGKPIRDPKVLDRVKRIGIPPAWTGVWICPYANGHIQATGRDQKGRKQYRYHPRWREVRDETKYDRMIAFGLALPAIRARVDQDLALPGLPREKVLAAVLRLLETTLIRVGNEEYAKKNRSFGLTTLRDRHVDIQGSKVAFRFRGKSGKEHTISMKDRRLARIVKKCQDVPGQELFQYVDEDGQRRSIDSSDVNAYLREISGHDFSAKDFRTWAGTVLAAQTLKAFELFETQSQAKKNIVQAIEEVASRLGNTRTICRKCYVHPAVLDAYLEGHLLETLRQRAEEELDEALRRLDPEEAAVLAFLQARLTRELNEVQEAGKQQSA